MTHEPLHATTIAADGRAGLVGLADPRRTEAITAIAQARRAGIQTIMITGDQPVTAVAIARELGQLGPATSRARSSMPAPPPRTSCGWSAGRGVRARLLPGAS